MEDSVMHKIFVSVPLSISEDALDLLREELRTALNEKWAIPKMEIDVVFPLCRSVDRLIVEYESDSIFLINPSLVSR